MATKKSTSSTSKPRTRTTKAETAATTSPAAAAPTLAPDFHHQNDVNELIRQRAYELFEQRGGQHGFDIEDWCRAEAEILGRQS